MKAKGAAALAAFTPIALVLGFFMPDLACFVQDGSAPDVERFDTSPVQLNVAPPEDATDALLLLAHGYTAINLDSNSKEREGVALQAVQEALSFFFERGFEEFDPALYPSHEEKLLLATGVAGERAAKLWLCTLASESDPARWMSIVIDDASGMPVKLTASYPRDDATPEDKSARAEAAGAWAEAWADYLGFEHAATTVGRESSPAVSDEETSATFIATQPSDEIAVTLQGSDVDLAVSIAAPEGTDSCTLRAEPTARG